MEESGLESSSPDQLLRWSVLLVPLGIVLQAVPIADIGDHRVRSYIIAVSVVAFLTVVALGTRRQFELEPISSLAVVFVLAVLVSFLMNVFQWSPANIEEFGSTFVQLLLVVSMLIGIASLRPDARQIRIYLRWWAVLGVVVSLYSIYQALARTFDLPFAYLEFLTHQRGGTYAFLEPFVRPSGVFQEPSFLGVFLAVPFIVVAVFVFLSRWTLFATKARDAAALSILGLGIFISFSLSSHISLLVAFSVGAAHVLFSRRYPTASNLRLWPVAVVGVAFVPVVLGLWMAGIPILEGLLFRILSAATLEPLTGASFPVGSSVRPRLAAILAGLNVWVHHPVFGVGLGNLNFIIGEFQVVPFPEYANIRSSGSAWVTVLSNTGVVGFLPFAAMYLYAVVFTALVRPAEEEGPVNTILFALFLVLVFDSVTMWTTYTIYHPQRWLNLAMIAGLMGRYGFQLNEPPSSGDVPYSSDDFSEDD